MKASEAVQAEQARWDAFVQQSQFRSFLQTWAWGELQEKLHVPHWRIVVEDKGSIVATALVLERSLRFGYSWHYIPRGPIFLDGISGEDKALAWQVLEEKLKSLARERGAFFIRIDPLWNEFSRESWRKSMREVQPRHTLILDLALSQEKLLADMHPKTRYNIGVAERKGVTVEFSSNKDDVQKFLMLSQAVTSRSGFSYHPDAYYVGIMEALGKKGMAELAIATVGGKSAATHLMIYADGIATYAHGASSLEHRSSMAPALLYWKTILRAQEKGMQQYDFFGVAPEGASEDHPWAGITRMKTGFGGKRVSYCGAYDLVLKDSEGFYSMFNVVRKLRTSLKKSFT